MATTSKAPTRRPARLRFAAGMLALAAVTGLGSATLGLVHPPQPSPLGRPTATAATPSARPALRPAAPEQLYFVVTDRFANGDPGNDRGGLEGDRLATGFDPTDPGFYHGGDLAGVRQHLDYIQGLGTTAIWLTPSFVNRPVQGSGADASAGYHGYWVTDFTRIDPHLGTNEEMKALIADVHARGMKLYFDIITNHTADVIAPGDGRTGYVSEAERPYVDATGATVDDAALAAARAPFPALDPASMPHPPTFRTPADATAKKPAWLNDPTMYHNRGDSTFAGESTTYGDFSGLDDLFTERPEVVKGMTEIYDAWIDLGIDGFRVDTVKHVNLEFWQDFTRGILEHARAAGKPDFALVGEVNTPSADLVSEYTTAGGLPAALDFPLQEALAAVVGAGSSRKISDVLAADDLYLDADSSAASSWTFLGNHDLGRIGMLLPARATADERLARARLAEELLFLLRGQPVVYYGDEQGLAGTGGDKQARQDLFATQVPAWQQQAVIGAEPGSRDRYDTSHPLYRTIAGLSALRREHPVLATGQLVERSVDGPYVFSRIGDRREYVVVANTSLTAQEVTFPVSSRGRLTPVHGDAAAVDVAADGTATVRVPGLSTVVLRADEELPATTVDPVVTLGDLDLTDRTRGRTKIDATVEAQGPVSVAFWLREGEGEWRWLGTDDQPAGTSTRYGVRPDLEGLQPGAQVEVVAVAKDTSGREARASVTATVGG